MTGYQRRNEIIILVALERNKKHYKHEDTKNDYMLILFKMRNRLGQISYKETSRSWATKTSE